VGLPVAPERHEAGLETQAGQQHRRPVEAHVEWACEEAAGALSHPAGRLCRARRAQGREDQIGRREQAFNIHAAPFFALVLSNPLTAWQFGSRRP
jgi:hypothetical protein